MWTIFKSTTVIGFMPFAQFHIKILKKSFGKIQSSPYSILFDKSCLFKHNSGKGFKLIHSIKALAGKGFKELKTRKP